MTPHNTHRVHSFLESWGIINWLALRTMPPPAAAALPAGTRLALPAGAGGRPRLPEGYSLEAGGGGGGAAARARRGGGSAASLLQLRLPTVAEGVAAASAGGTLAMTSSKDARANRCAFSTDWDRLLRWGCLALIPCTYSTICHLFDRLH